MTSTTPSTLYLYSTTISDVGTVRSNNQDSSFAGSHLAVVCDGMGGHAGGDTASSITIRSLAHIEQGMNEDVNTVANMLQTSIVAAHDAITGQAKRDSKLAGMGTTVTALTLVNGYWILAHIGDSRAHLLRNNQMTRMTSDHSYVQHLINTGRISEAEARNHPQRNVVMRVLGDFDIDPSPDVCIIPAQPADRWLLCSDGLSGVLEHSTIEEQLKEYADQEECAQMLVHMALKAGSTDNVTAVIADASMALDASNLDVPHQTPLIGGAASSNLEAIADIINAPVASAPTLAQELDSPAQKAAALCQNTTEHAVQGTRVALPSSEREEVLGQQIDTGEIPVIQKSDGQVSSDPHDPEVRKHMLLSSQRQLRRRKLWRRIIVAAVTLLVLGAISAGSWFAYAYTQSLYFLTVNNNQVTIYRGLYTDLFGFKLYHEVEQTSIRADRLPDTWVDQLKQGIEVDSLSQARAHADLIARQVRDLSKDQEKELKKEEQAKDTQGKAQQEQGDETEKTKQSQQEKSQQSQQDHKSATQSSNTGGDA